MVSDSRPFWHARSSPLPEVLRPDCTVHRAEFTQTFPHFVTAMMRFGDETPKRPCRPGGVLVKTKLQANYQGPWHWILLKWLRTNVWCPGQILGTKWCPRRNIFWGYLYFTLPRSAAWSFWSRSVAGAESPAWTKLTVYLPVRVNVNELNSRKPADPTPWSWVAVDVVAASALPLPRPAKSLE